MQNRAASVNTPTADIATKHKRASSLKPEQTRTASTYDQHESYLEKRNPELLGYVLALLC